MVVQRHSAAVGSSLLPFHHQLILSGSSAEKLPFENHTNGTNLQFQQINSDKNNFDVLRGSKM